MSGCVTDCCNAIAANGEAGVGCSHIGLMLRGKL